MTKFSSKRDVGYVRVQDQLWLWVENLVVAPQGVSNQGNEENMQRTTEFSGTVYSGGGLVIQGTQNAGRDIVYNNTSSTR